MKKLCQILFFVVCIILLVSACGIGSAAPAPGADFAGTIDMGSSAESGSIQFSISQSGTSLEDLGITVNGITCKAMTVGKASDFQAIPQISITNGRFSADIPAIGRIAEKYNLGTTPEDFPVIESLDTVGKIAGQFTGTNEARGTITLYMWVLMTDRACEMGTFNWTAEVK